MIGFFRRLSLVVRESSLVDCRFIKREEVSNPSVSLPSMLLRAGRAGEDTKALREEFFNRGFLVNFLQFLVTFWEINTEKIESRQGAEAQRGTKRGILDRIAGLMQI